MFQFLVSVITTLAFCSTSSAQIVEPAETTASSPKPPNVVYILAADLGFGDLVCYNATNVETPNLHALAKAGRKFTDAHSASAVCTPSRYQF